MQEDEAVWDLYIRNDGLLRSLFWLAHVCTFEFYRSAWMFVQRSHLLSLQLVLNGTQLQTSAHQLDTVDGCA